MHHATASDKLIWRLVSMLTNIVGEQPNADCQSDHDPGNENRWRHQIDLPFQRSAMAKRAAGDRNRGHGTIMARRFDPGYRDTFVDGHGLGHRGPHRAVCWTESVGCARAGSASRVVMADLCRPTSSHSQNPNRYYFFRIYMLAY